MVSIVHNVFHDLIILLLLVSYHLLFKIICYFMLLCLILLDFSSLLFEVCKGIEVLHGCPLVNLCNLAVDITLRWLSTSKDRAWRLGLSHYWRSFGFTSLWLHGRVRLCRIHISLLRSIGFTIRTNLLKILRRETRLRSSHRHSVISCPILIISNWFQ